MEDTEQLHQLHIQVQDQEAKEAESLKNRTITSQLPLLCKINYKWWLRIIFFTFFVLSGQSTGTLLLRFYFNNGGKSKWVAASVQVAGFPILLPPLFLSHFFSNPTKLSINTANSKKLPSAITLSLIYLSLGLLAGGDTMLYTYGLYYLPVSTYSLICATQLAFNATFSFFLNSQKFTPFILNSLVLLTISASLLVVGVDSKEPKGVPKGKFTIGFICTVAASAAYSLLVSLMQLSFQKVIKRDTVIVVLEMIIYVSFVATCFCVVGLFASGEWKGVVEEMDGFGQGKSSYVMTLVWTAISWQVCSLGSVGLIFEVSSLFSNVISTFALPLIPILAVIFFHDKMDGVKVVAMLLAIWGFVSYIYQHYLDDCKSKFVKTNVIESFDNSCTE